MKKKTKNKVMKRTGKRTLRDETYARYLERVCEAIRLLRGKANDPKVFACTPVDICDVTEGMSHQSIGIFMKDERAAAGVKEGLDLAEFEYRRDGKRLIFMCSFKDGVASPESPLAHKTAPVPTRATPTPTPTPRPSQPQSALAVIPAKGQGKGRRKKIDEFTISVSCFELDGRWSVDLRVNGNDTSIETKLEMPAGSIERLQAGDYPDIGDRIVEAFERLE